MGALSMRVILNYDLNNPKKKVASNIGASRRGYTDAARDSVVKLAYRVRRWFEKLLYFSFEMIF